jgi:anti-sigma B factor antagonist
MYNAGLCCFGQLAPLPRVLLQMSPRFSVSGDGGITMSLKITNSEVDGVSLVALNGRIVLGEESTALREKLKSLIAGGKQKIVLNMADIDYIDSSGLGALVAAHLSAKNAGASIRLCNLGKKFHEVMQLTKLLTIFDVYETEAAAVASFPTSVAASN